MIRTCSWILGLYIMLSGALLPTSVHAETILTLKAGSTEITFDRTEIEALPQTETVTGTEWTNGTSVFTGPLVRDVLAMTNANDATYETVTATAANHYSVDIPASDFEKYDVILAMTMDGKQLTLRDKGPLWIVYPQDDHPELKERVVISRWIWQLVSLELK